MVIQLVVKVVVEFQVASGYLTRSLLEFKLLFCIVQLVYLTELLGLKQGLLKSFSVKAYLANFF